jgi:hypothetical protein
MPPCGMPEAAWKADGAVWRRKMTGFAYKRRSVMPSQCFALSRKIKVIG